MCHQDAIYQMGQIKQIESVQRSFTRRLLYHTCIYYKTRLLRLGVDSLEIRRLRQDLIYTYNIVFGLVTNTENDFFTLANSVNANINTRGHMYKLFPHFKAAPTHANTFSLSELCACGTVYHAAEKRHFSSLIQFKNFISSVDSSIYVFLGCCVFNCSFSYSYFYCSCCS